MNRLLKFLLPLFVIFIFTGCSDISDNPVKTSVKNQTDSNTQPVFNLSMMVAQNGNLQSYLLYDGSISFSYPMYGCSTDAPFYSRKGESTFEVTCSYSWQNNTANYIAGEFIIYNTTDNFYWYKDIFCNGNSSGSITTLFTDAQLQPGKTYYARLCNGYYDNDGNFVTQ
jgi:hypothetical protein